MNILLNDLRKSSWLKAIDANPEENPRGGLSESPCIHEDYDRIFAELILKECLAVVESVNVVDYASDLYDIGYDDGLTQAQIIIKEHFGINK
jgi:hypothetical protein